MIIKKLIELIEVVLRRLGVDNADTMAEQLVQFIKFGLVGVSNTLLSYGIEMLCYYVLLVNVPWPERTRVIVVTALAFTVSVINSYYWNNRYVFVDKERITLTSHICACLKMAACYAVTGLVLSPILKLWLVEHDVSYWLASLGVLLISVPLNFILNKLWAFRKVVDDETNIK